METERFKGRYRIQSTRWRSWDYGNDAAYFVTICTQDRRCDFGSIMNGAMQLSPLGQVAWECWQAIPDHFPFVHLGEFVVMPNHVHGILVIDRARTGMSAGDRSGIAATSVETQNFASLRSGGSADPAGSDGSGHSAIPAKPGPAAGNTTATPILGSTGIAAASVETQNFASLRSDGSADSAGSDGSGGLAPSVNPSDPAASADCIQPTADRRRHQANRFGPQSQNLGSILRGFKIGVKKYATLHQIPFAWQPRYHDHVIRNAREYERIQQYIIKNPVRWATDDLR